MIGNEKELTMAISEKDKETALLVIVGDWECSTDGVWKFIVQTNCLAQCIMVCEHLTLASLKLRIEEEFQSDVEGVVERMSYYPPTEMSIFSSGRIPPVSINTDAALQTFYKLHSTTKALNLFVCFGAPADNVTIPGNSERNQNLPIINLADGTPSFDSVEVVESTYQPSGYARSIDIQVADGCNGFGLTEAGVARGLDLNSIYDAAMIAQLENLEEMARQAEGLTVNKGKEKITYPEPDTVGSGQMGQREQYGSGSGDAYENNFWSEIISREYRALQLGEPMVQGESSTAIRFMSVPDDDRNNSDSREDYAAAMGDSDGDADVEDNLDEGINETVEGGYEDFDGEMQLSLVNIYNEIIEADVVPQHDCAAYFEDDFVESQEVPETVFDPENDAIFIGRIFSDKGDMQIALAIYAIKRFFNFKQIRSDKERLIVRCVDMKCPWRVYGHTVGGSSQNMEVRTARLTHTCDITTRSQYGKKASCRVIASLLQSKYANGKLGPRAVDIPDIVLDELRVCISYMKAWHSKEKAVIEARGSAEESYKLLMVYLHLLKKTNPGTICDVVSKGFGTAKCKFKYLFFALGACIEAQKHMRRVVIIDATTIKSKFRGCLLTASFQDGNFQIMPLGFGVVDCENEAAWTWFFKQLVNIVPDADDLVFVSDRHTSIYPSLRKVYPRAKHGACTVHLYRNVKSRYGRQKGLAYLVAKAASAYTVGEFRNKFSEIERRSPSCANYLRGIGISHWTRVYFQGKRFNIMSSNAAESLNAAMAKALEFPIVSMVETIRMMLMRWFFCRRTKADQQQGPVTPEVEEMLMKNLASSGGLSVSAASSSVFQVNEKNGKSFIVDFERKTCTCKVFETLGIPCSHALAAARSTGTPIPQLVEKEYTTEVWRAAYSSVIMPVPNSEDENVPEELEDSGALPPDTNVVAGRPRKRRIPSIGENSGTKRAKNGPYRCTRCFGTGHNRATCKNPIP